MEKKDYRGERFGMLVARWPTEKRVGGNVVWLMECDCGKETEIPTSKIRRNRSCGCQQFGKEGYIPKHRKHALYAAIRYRHKRSTGSIDGVIDIDTFWSASNENCHYCDAPPSNQMLGETYQGLDKVDPSGGYTYDNIVPCCFKCNFAKQDMSLQEFRDHVIRIYNHLEAQDW